MSPEFKRSVALKIAGTGSVGAIIFSQLFGQGEISQVQADSVVTPTPTPEYVLSKAPRFNPTATETPARVCAQVITYARNPITGKVEQFPTPCSVPKGYLPLGRNAAGSGGYVGRMLNERTLSTPTVTPTVSATPYTNRGYYYSR